MGQKVGNKPKTYATERNLQLRNNEGVGGETKRVPVMVRRLIEMLAVPLCEAPREHHEQRHRQHGWSRLGTEGRR